MRKFLVIIFLGLLLSGNAYAEAVLRCILDGQRITVEVNLEKKIIHVNDSLFEIITIGESVITAKSKDSILKLDRFDGFIEIKSENKFVGYCKNYNRLF
tara:strand:- start:134 stop:430 length:297 start_codon:yes stop_codon:yes gene_type:complete